MLNRLGLTASSLSWEKQKSIIYILYVFIAYYINYILGSGRARSSAPTRRRLHTIKIYVMYLCIFANIKHS